MHELILNDIYYGMTVTYEQINPKHFKTFLNLFLRFFLCNVKYKTVDFDNCILTYAILKHKIQNTQFN